MAKYLDESGLKHYTEKLKTSYFDYVDAMRSDVSKDVASPQIVNETWTIKDANGNVTTSTSKPSDLETGHTIKWSGSWKWTSDANHQNPKTVSGTWGTTIPASGTASSVYSTTDFVVPSGKQIATVTTRADKTGGVKLENNKIVPITGDAYTHTNSVTEPVINPAYKYYGFLTKKTGITAADLKTLTSVRSTSVNLTLNGFNNANKYFVYAYLSNANGTNKMSKFEVAGDGAYDIAGLFGTDAPQTIKITNSAGTEQTYFLYVMQVMNNLTSGAAVTIS